MNHGQHYFEDVVLENDRVTRRRHLPDQRNVKGFIGRRGGSGAIRGQAHTSTQGATGFAGRNCSDWKEL
jgi:hypothetical protein